MEMYWANSKVGTGVDRAEDGVVNSSGLAWWGSRALVSWVIPNCPSRSSSRSMSYQGDFQVLTPVRMFVGFFGLGLILVVGCGGPPELKRTFADVTGKVSYQGAALKMGTVTFQPAAGAAVEGQIGPDGTYSVKAVIGPNRVMVVSREEAAGPPSPDPAARKAAEAAAKGQPKVFVPESYGTAGSSLSFEVKAGTNKADFDLK